jgi:hypothetical protein
MIDHRMRPQDLERRLRPFLDAGLMTRIPTTFQIRQGECAMLPYVLSSDATDEAQYTRSVFGHPIVRQFLILSMVGRDHLNPGCSLGARFESIATHLLATFHQGMPVFDLQLMHTHPNGLGRFREILTEHLARATPRAKRRARWIGRILVDPNAYHQLFLGEQGFIARAERMDYRAPEAEGSDLPPEFFSLAGFLEHCARTYPPAASDVGWSNLPRHLLGLLGRRFREGKGLGLGVRREALPAPVSRDHARP